jgi:imidazolonepropionase-like amidohydrolase
MQRSDTWAVPTETLIDNFANADDPQVLVARPETIYLPRALQTRYETALAEGRDGAADARRALAVRAEIIAAMQAAGVGLLLGSDSPQIFNVPGFSIHRELAAMVTAGLSPAQALAMGTTAPARYFGLTDEFGALRVGLAADLLLLEADPTADIANSRRIRGVMARGRWLDRDALDAGLAEIARGR